MEPSIRPVAGLTELVEACPSNLVPVAMDLRDAQRCEDAVKTAVERARRDRGPGSFEVLAEALRAGQDEFDRARALTSGFRDEPGSSSSV